MVGTALLVGGAFGVRHAFEADHVAAVATLVEAGDRSGSTGAAWGIGHALPILVLGGAFLALDLTVPPAVAAGFEAVVGVVLVVLGARVIAGREAIGTAIMRHVHGTGNGDVDGGETGHPHLSVRGREVGLTHSHARADGASFAVGIVHGLAGSGGVVVALAAAAPTVAAGAAFLTGFALASIATMALAAAGWGSVVGRTDVLRLVAGVASVAVGLLLLADVAGVGVPL